MSRGVPAGDRAAVLPLRGLPHRVEVRVAPLGRSRVVRSDSTIWVLMAPAERRRPEQLLGAWLRAEARRVIVARVAQLAERHRFRYGRIFVRAQKSRWGSCSSRGNLSFNFRLILAPPEILDYVILHELAHLRVPDHSPRFWRLVETLCPDYRSRRRWLRLRERRLMDLAL
ncbi:M48 family metallopeptidase [Geochorda subterranea]|uniref:M48 family metallopeptidase n=1 Tax=Geochorda subterranea TaxID=3109564 RepID=A0ABZ1BQH0_9FIRM|nr:M48 family metallopeptidase [Limnochorda sp. LNt]WRP15055.1 M48 family metallopeptidase [Limnochorda sp. LNt]